MRQNNGVKVLFAVAVTEGAGLIGSIFTVSAISTWYAALEKPVWNPPNWIFAPVWTALYFFMGIAVFLVWQRRNANKAVYAALVMFGVQLVLNVAWSYVFFGAHAPGFALAEIIALWFSIVGTIILFYKISRPAAALLFPYIAWVTFAAYLNYAIFVLN